MFLEPLKNLKKLANLHTEQNQIKNFKSIKGLECCEKLQSVYFQTLSGGQQNEICKEIDYRNRLFALLPCLYRLDGIPKNMEFDNGESLKQVKDVKIDTDMSSTGFWYTKNYPKVEIPKEIRLDGEEELKRSMKDCKTAISALETKLKVFLCDEQK